MTDTWTTTLEAWAISMRAARCSEQTIGLRIYHLTRLARWTGERDPWTLTLDDLIGWTGSHRWARETARSYRSSLRRFWSWAVLTDRTTHDPARALPVIPPAVPRPNPAPAAAVEAAMREADDRVLLMVMLADDVGMRRGEVAQVHSDDLTRDLLGWTLRVHGKGSRERDVPLPDDLARRLLALPVGFAFPGDVEGHLSARWVGTLVGRLLPTGVTMHQLRHRCATDLHDQTKDLRLVQTLLGHASLTTTQRYVKVRDGAVRSAVRERSAHRAA